MCFERQSLRDWCARNELATITEHEIGNEKNPSPHPSELSSGQEHGHRQQENKPTEPKNPPTQRTLRSPLLTIIAVTASVRHVSSTFPAFLTLLSQPKRRFPSRLRVLSGRPALSTAARDSYLAERAIDNGQPSRTRTVTISVLAAGASTSASRTIVAVASSSPARASEQAASRPVRLTIVLVGIPDRRCHRQQRFS